MTLSNLLLGFVFSTLFGALYHLWRGGKLGRLLLYLFLAWIGFWLGHLVADFTGLSLVSLGTLHLGIASISALFTLMAGHWLFLSGSLEE